MLAQSSICIAKTELQMGAERVKKQLQIARSPNDKKLPVSRHRVSDSSAICQGLRSSKDRFLNAR
jgi:hypothetical protein